MSANQDAVMLDWLKEQAENIKFNFLSGKLGDRAFIIIGNPKGPEDILGNRLRAYDFALQAILSHSEGADDTNLENMQLMREWQDWIDEQQADKNYPDFGPDCSEYCLLNLNDSPELAQIQQNNKMAKYQFFARLEYVEKG